MQVKNRKKGSVLILSFWVLGLLSVFAIYLGINVRQKLNILNRVKIRDELYLIAESGVKKALTEVGKIDCERTWVSLKQAWSCDEGLFSQIILGNGTAWVGYYYRENDFNLSGSADKQLKMFGAEDAQARINLNTVERRVLVRLIKETAGLEAFDSGEIADSIIDWRDEDDMSLANGAEKTYYHSLSPPYDCKNSVLETIEELRYVKGINNVILSRLMPYITVYGSGSVNINTASATVLSAVGLDESLVKKILMYRCGEDGIASNKDDREFTDISAVVPNLSQVFALAPSEAAELSNIVAEGKISTASDVFLIQSTAQLKNKASACRISCVVAKENNPELQKAGWFLSWRTEYFLNQ